MIWTESRMFTEGQGVRPKTNLIIEIEGGDLLAVLDNGLLAYDATAATAVNDFIGGRPCINMTNSGSGATDVVNGQSGRCLQPQAGKIVRVKGSFRMTTTTQEFFLGLAATDTNIFSTYPTDYLAIRKATGDAVFYLVSRKASGTEATWALTPTIAVDTWYDFEIVAKRDASTAGKGSVQVYLGVADPGNVIPQAFNGTVETQFPDTVDLGLSLGWRAGSAANVSGYVGCLGLQVEG